MKNILFIGPYRQNDGWGIASKRYLEALMLTDTNLVARPIYLNNFSKTFDQTDRYNQVEEKHLGKYDCVIQHSLPDQFIRIGGTKNIGLCFFESASLPNHPWIEQINLMDELWVSSSWESLCLKRSGVNIPIKVIPIPCDTTVYEGKYDYPPLDEHDHEFKFYFVGEYIKRKNIEALIVAFNREFGIYEPVRLVLKLNFSGLDGYSLLQKVKQDITTIKNNMGFYPALVNYKSEIIITEYLTDQQLYGLHSKCDCFVNPSSGEAFSMPTFDAMGFGKVPIVNKHTGMTDFIDYSLGFCVSSHQVPAIDPNRPIPNLYSTRDTWFNISIIDLQKKMRDAFSLHNHIPTQWDSMKKHGIDRAKSYSYKNIARILNENFN